jgi:hypothetical protein
MMLYRHLKSLEAQPQPTAVPVAYTAETVEAQVAGTGIGSKTLLKGALTLPGRSHYALHHIPLLEEGFR